METLDEKLKEIREMQEAVDQLRNEVRAEAVQKVQSIISAFELSSNDFDFKNDENSRRRSRVTRVVPTKYIGPNGEKWSGRGLLPRWITELERQGRHREEFLVEKH